MNTFLSLRVVIRLPGTGRRSGIARPLVAAVALAALAGAHSALVAALWQGWRADSSTRQSRGEPVREVDLWGEPPIRMLDSLEHDTGELLADTGDLDRIIERGALRVIVTALEEDRLPRQGWSAAAQLERAAKFADFLGLPWELVLVSRHDALIPALEAGHGDLIAAQLMATADRREKVAFTHPTATVAEWLVGRKGGDDLPEKLEDLSGRAIHVRRSSPSFQILERLDTEQQLGLRIVSVAESLDTETIVFEVSEGKRPLTVVDSNQLDSIETYNDRVQRLFPIGERRKLGWAVRKDNPDLLAAADQFIMAHIVAGGASTGDLDEIKQRDSLRVLTVNSPVHYFLFRGQQMGFDYELVRLGARQLGVRLEMVVPPSRDLLIPWLLEGRGDVVAAGTMVTPNREKVVAFSRPYMFVHEGDGRLLEAEQTNNDDGQNTVVFKEGGDMPIAFALRPNNPQIKAFFDRFVKDVYRGVEYRAARQRYFPLQRSNPVETEPRPTARGQLTPYDGFFKEYSRRYGIDWRLMAAQAYQESRFDPNARSWAGGRGLFQILPRTARELGVADVSRPEAGIEAGIKCMSRLLSRFGLGIPHGDRIGFALAAYTVGWSHVRDARRLAAQKGWDPNKWFDHTEKAMLLLEQPSYYHRAGSGYCRGSEVVDYVAQIQRRHHYYAGLFPG